MREWKSQSHVRWYCRYHIVIVPKYRRKSMFGAMRKQVGEILRELCARFGGELIEGHVMPNHVHMCIAIPPKESIANFIGKLKGKSTIIIAQRFIRQRNFKGINFWSRGYCVSTVGLEEATIIDYIRHQEKVEKETEQLSFGL